MADSTASSGTPAEGVDLDTLVGRANALHEQGYFEAARQLVMEVLTRQKDHVGALIVLANALRDLGRFDEALRVLTRALQISPDNTQALSSAALTFFFKEDWPRAWRSFNVRCRRGRRRSR